MWCERATGACFEKNLVIGSTPNFLCLKKPAKTENIRFALHFRPHYCCCFALLNMNLYDTKESLWTGSVVHVPFVLIVFNIICFLYKNRSKLYQWKPSKHTYKKAIYIQHFFKWMKSDNKYETVFCWRQFDVDIKSRASGSKKHVYISYGRKVYHTTSKTVLLICTNWQQKSTWLIHD